MTYKAQSIAGGTDRVSWSGILQTNDLLSNQKHMAEAIWEVCREFRRSVDPDLILLYILCVQAVIKFGAAGRDKPRPLAPDPKVLLKRTKKLAVEAGKGVANELGEISISVLRELLDIATLQK
jgi:hypothetical protein